MSVLTGNWTFHIRNGSSTVDFDVFINDTAIDNTVGTIEVTRNGDLLGRGIRIGTGLGTPPDVRIVLIGASSGFEAYYGRCFRANGSSVIDRIRGKRKRPNITSSSVSEPASADDDWTSEKTTT